MRHLVHKYEGTKEQKDAQIVAWFVVLFLMIILLAILCSGCASYTITDPQGKVISQGSATGFLRTITVIEKYKDNQCVERKISTDSTTKDVLMGLDHFVDTTVNTAAKLKP